MGFVRGQREGTKTRCGYYQTALRTVKNGVWQTWNRMAEYATSIRGLTMTESIKFYLTWEEYFAAQEFFRRQHQSIAPEWVAGVLLILAGAALLFFDGLGVFAIAVMLLGGVVIVAGPQVRRLASNRKWRREPLFETEHEVAFSDAGVYFRMGIIESNLDWKYYQQVMESPEGLLLVYGNESFNLLPRRAFADERLLNEFRSLATQNLH